jgi:hypothetical protein
VPQDFSLVPDMQDYRSLNWGNVMKIALYVAALCSMISFNSPVLAACVQGDLTGVWRIYGSGVSSQGYYGWVRCKVVVGNTGAFNTGSSWCKDELGTTASGTRGISVGREWLPSLRAYKLKWWLHHNY